MPPHADVRKELHYGLTDIDIALGVFRGHFEAWRNIKFKFPVPRNGDSLDTKLADVWYALDKLGWQCTYNKQDIPNSKTDYSGFMYGKKHLNGETLEYAVAGFLYYDKNSNVTADGTLYGHKKDELDGIYKRLLEIAATCFGKVTELKPEAKHTWNR
ncbi:MAG: hypothetical protein V1839_00135 [archaeon]